MGKIKGHVASDEENQGSRPLPLVLEIQHRSSVKVFYTPESGEILNYTSRMNTSNIISLI